MKCLLNLAVELPSVAICLSSLMQLPLLLQSLMSTTAFGLGSKYFALYEVAGVGIQWRTINQSPVEGDDFNLLLSMVMLIIDATVYGVLTWYIEAVHPGEQLGTAIIEQS